MQLPKLINLDQRQINPAAFSGVTDQISNAGQAVGDKASHAASGLTKTQLSVVIVVCIVGLVAAIAALFWICSCSRRRKRAREMREKSERLQSSPSNDSVFVPVSNAKAAEGEKRSSHQLKGYNDGWGDSRVALNSSYVASTNERYGWDQSQTQLPSLPKTPKQSHRY